MKNKQQNIKKNKTIQLTIFDICPELLNYSGAQENEISDPAASTNTSGLFNQEFDEDSEDYKNQLQEFSAEAPDSEKRERLKFDPAAFDWLSELKISLD